MLVKKYKSKIVSISNKIEGIYTLEFKSLGRRYKYKPGQFLHLAIDNEYDGVGQWPDSRCFSLQSNPEEDIIKITFAVKGSFTREMETTLKVGSEVWLKLAYGDLFSQDHSKSNTVFIAGGTGITPYLSLFSHPSFQEYESPNIYLGFKSERFNIYKSELEKIESSHQIKTFYENVDGVLDIRQIFKESDSDSSYFISGPPEMIKKFKANLIEFGVSQENILTDDWE